MQTDQASDRSSTGLVLALLPRCCSSQQEFQPPGSELVLVTRFHGILLSGNRKTDGAARREKGNEATLRAVTPAGSPAAPQRRSQCDE